MPTEDEEGLERLQNAMSMRNLADRLQTIMKGPSIPLSPESRTEPPEKTEEPPKK
jgi:hypothetical protein